MGASTSKVDHEPYETSSAISFAVVYDGRDGRWSKKATLAEPWASRSLEKSLLAPAIKAYNAEQRSAKDHIKAATVGWVEIDGKLADPSAPTKSFARQGEVVEVFISQAPDSCIYRISLQDEQNELKLNKYWLSKSIEEALIRPFVKTYNERSLTAPISMKDVDTVTILGRDVALATPAYRYAPPRESQPVDVHIQLKPQRGWSAEDLQSPMESALAQLRSAAASLRVSRRAPTALKSIESVMSLLETTAEPELWRVDMRTALQQRERRGSFASSTTAAGGAADDGVRRWLIDLISPAQRDSNDADEYDDGKSAAGGGKFVPGGSDTLSDESSALGSSMRARSLDTTDEAKRMLCELSWSWDVDVFDELSGGNAFALLFTHLVADGPLATELDLSRGKMIKFVDEVQRESPHGARCTYSGGTHTPCTGLLPAATCYLLLVTAPWSAARCVCVPRR